MVLEQEDPLRYNIEEVFGSFTYDVLQREVSWKKFGKVKEDDGTARDINEDEVLFERTDEDLMLLATSLVALNQEKILNIYLLNENITEAELVKKKL